MFVGVRGRGGGGGGGGGAWRLGELKIKNYLGDCSSKVTRPNDESFFGGRRGGGITKDFQRNALLLYCTGQDVQDIFDRP